VDTLTDTHCHLDFDAFDEDRDAVLERAWEAGLTRILAPGIDLKSSADVRKIVERSPKLFAAVGVHPNSALSWGSTTRDTLVDLAQHPKVKAIGEIGLDYYRDRTPKNIQTAVLLAQLDIARELDLPVVLHNREATDDLLDILTDWHANLVKSEAELANRPGVLHSFSGNLDQAERAMALGFYIGFTGPVTFKNAPALQSLVGLIPLARLLIETDAPFLSPHPLRGRRNEPANVRLVAEKIAEIQGCLPVEVCRETAANAQRLFSW
jgi:TatD DNase family protein